MLTLRFKKTLDADATLTMIRADGSAAWTPIGAADGFGPVHDLAHVVVERQLLLVNGTLALVARGASFADFDDTAATRIGPDAIHAEAVAGLLALEVLTGHRLPIAAFNEGVATRCAALRPGFRVADLTPSALHSLRTELAALRRQWEGLDLGATLELQFGADDRSTPEPPGRAPLTVQ